MKAPARVSELCEGFHRRGGSSSLGACKQPPELLDADTLARCEAGTVAGRCLRKRVGLQRIRNGVSQARVRTAGDAREAAHEPATQASAPRANDDRHPTETIETLERGGKRTRSSQVVELALVRSRKFTPSILEKTASGGRNNGEFDANGERNAMTACSSRTVSQRRESSRRTPPAYSISLHSRTGDAARGDRQDGRRKSALKAQIRLLGVGCTLRSPLHHRRRALRKGIFGRTRAGRIACVRTDPAGRSRLFAGAALVEIALSLARAGQTPPTRARGAMVITKIEGGRQRSTRARAMRLVGALASSPRRLFKPAYATAQLPTAKDLQTISRKRISSPKMTELARLKPTGTPFSDRLQARLPGRDRVADSAPTFWTIENPGPPPLAERAARCRRAWLRARQRPAQGTDDLSWRKKTGRARLITERRASGSPDELFGSL